MLDRGLKVQCNPYKSERCKATKTPASNAQTNSRIPILPSQSCAETLTLGTSRRVLRSIVFADFAEFSRLQDCQVAGFLELLAKVGIALEEVTPPEAYVRTLGDGILAVMRKAAEAADFALALNRAVQDGNRSIRNLNVEMRARIALHTGPMILARDPVAKTAGYYGSHVNRAARLEQVTKPGHIYATTEFVDNLKREVQNNGLGSDSVSRHCVCEYYGILNLAKNFGTQGVFEIRDQRSVEEQSSGG